MTDAWDATFRAWAQPPSDTEDARCENAVRMVKKAIDASAALASRNIEVLGQGSYRNNTNVRLDSDVDVCVRCFDTVYQDYTFAPGASDVEAGLSPATYSHRAFKDELEGAMRAYFGSGEVTRGNKVILIHENTYRISADVAPTFERRRYHRNAQGALWYESGTMLLLDRGGAIENWPHQHYDSGVAKNARTSKRFKAIVRIIKRLRNLMQEAGTFVGPAPSYLLECLVWNAPDSCFAHATLGEDIRSVMAFLVVNTASDPQCAAWVEVNERKYLFHFSQTWSREQAHSFLAAGWARLGLG